MDDILLNEGETEAEHQAYVDKILQQCVNHVLAVNLTKSEFDVHEIIFLGHIGTGSQVQMDAAKLEIMSNWPVPTKEIAVQPFLGFANNYRRLSKNYSAKIRTLIGLSKDVPFSCGHQQQEALYKLRTRFLSARILT